MKPRVLMVTFNRLLPADQGNARRIMQLVALYERQGWEVDLLYHAEEGHDPTLSRGLAARFGLVRVQSSRAPKPIEQPAHVCPLLDWYDPRLEDTARRMHRLRGYQAVHVNYVWYTPLLEAFDGSVRKVLDSHDVFADRAERYREAGMPPRWFSCTRADEDAAFRRADAVLAIQREEAREMAARGHRHILYLPYVEPRVREFVPVANGRPLTLGYLGSGNDWNIRSLQAFLDAAQAAGGLPHPLLVAGAVARHIPDTPGVRRLGFVRELSDFYDAVDLAINPMVGGTGLKIKTVEPLCFGRPVLCTPAGAQGLGHLWQLPVVEDAAAMVQALAGLPAEPGSAPLRALLAQAAASRAALDAEHEAQVGRFARWLSGAAA